MFEAADMFGANHWQAFFKVRLPLAWPAVLLALNQTLRMAAGMVVITSLIGTRGPQPLSASERPRSAKAQ